MQVVRSLAACQGALLLVDSTQGVQAQTLSTAKAAAAAGLKLVPVVTKIDLPSANVTVRHLHDALVSSQEYLCETYTRGSRVLLDRVRRQVVMALAGALDTKSHVTPHGVPRAAGFAKPGY